MLNDGGRVPVEAAVVPIDGDDLTVIVLRDMSDLATSEQMIDWYRMLVERMPVGVMLVQAVKRVPDSSAVVAANDAASKAYGRDLTCGSARTWPRSSPSRPTATTVAECWPWSVRVAPSDFPTS